MPFQQMKMFSVPMIRMLVSALIAFVLDQLSKLAILHWLDLASVRTIHVWPPYLNFVMAWNTGINFGLLKNHDGHWLLVAVSVLVSIGLVAWVRNKPGWLVPVATGAIVGGALGNALDRVLYGAVVDYLNMGCCGVDNPYSFNVADVLIAAGTVVIALYNRRDRET
jgi:signal peptidase II